MGTKRIGHAGTLDPFATGLLVLLVNHATRLLPYLPGDPKVYEAGIAFGAETDTDDLTGERVRTARPPDADAVHRAVDALTGPIEQVPPAYSAKQVGGRRAYDAARKGAPLDLRPVRVHVHAWQIRSMTQDRVEATITCGGGTYIRALARDLGRLSGSAAHLVSLRRIRSGPFDVRDAVTLESLGSEGVRVLPALAAVPHLALTHISSEDVVHVRHGRTVPAPDTDASMTALVAHGAQLVAIAERVDSAWQPRVVLPDA